MQLHFHFPLTPSIPDIFSMHVIAGLVQKKYILWMEIFDRHWVTAVKCFIVHNFTNLIVMYWTIISNHISRCNQALRYHALKWDTQQLTSEVSKKNGLKIMILFYVRAPCCFYMK